MSFVDKTLARLRSLLATDKEQIQATDSIGELSSRMFGSPYEVLQSAGYEAVSEYLRLDFDLLTRYTDFEVMDDYGEVASVLDTYADEATQPDTPSGKRVWITAKDRDIQLLLNDLLHRTLRIEEDTWPITRTACKYGADVEEIILREGEGVVALGNLPTYSMRRVEGIKGELYGFIQCFNKQEHFTPQDLEALLRAQKGKQESVRVDTPVASMASYSQSPYGSRTANMDLAIAFEPWQIAHFRNPGRQRRAVYGTSVLESARWIWKRLTLLEDAALIYRLQRAPERFAFYVDVGSRPLPEALKLLNAVRQQYRKKRFINPASGKMDLKMETIAQLDDFFIPVVNGAETTRIENLGSPAWQHMDDVQYFLNKFYTSVLAPKAYFSQDEGFQKPALTSNDIRFARTCLRVQQGFKLGVEKVCRVHLAALNIPPDAVEYDVHMAVPSSIFELAQLEVKNARADYASRIRDDFPGDYILKHVYGISDDEVKEIKGRKEKEMAAAEQSMESVRRVPVAVDSGDSRKLDLLLSHNQRLSSRVRDVQGLLEDIRMARKSSRNS